MGRQLMLARGGGAASAPGVPVHSASTRRSFEASFSTRVATSRLALTDVAAVLSGTGAARRGCARGTGGDASGTDGGASGTGGGASGTGDGASGSAAGGT